MNRSDTHRRGERDESTSNSSQSIVYGLNAVMEAIRAGKRSIDSITILESARPDRVKALVDLARQKRIPVHRVPRLDLDRNLGEARHQGVVARLAAARYTDPD
ncbi:MAG TPA: RNA methyltransferase substrate-binding domain-containing protein, partial [Pyrinomonadaceae bacterium]|nr:RNA methyltransferase substrate-binding domain-containing protein [Pyrinomonadaceae bacterium]